MSFLLWIVLGLHLFSVVVWLGGILYQSAIVIPVARVGGAEVSRDTLPILRRFLPFVWMCVWTILITGVCLMLFDPRFVFFRYQDRWSVMLGLKQCVFLLMIFFSFGYARMLARVGDLISTHSQIGVSEAAMPYYQRMVQFGRINVALAIASVLLAAALD